MLSEIVSYCPSHIRKHDMVYFELAYFDERSESRWKNFDKFPVAFNKQINFTIDKTHPEFNKISACTRMSKLTLTIVGLEDYDNVLYKSVELGTWESGLGTRDLGLGTHLSYTSLGTTHWSTH